MSCIRYDFNPVGWMVAPNCLSIEGWVGFGIDIQIVRPPQRKERYIEFFQGAGRIFVHISPYKSPALWAYTVQKSSRRHLRRGKQAVIGGGHLSHRCVNVTLGHPCALQPRPSVIITLPLPGYRTSDKHKKVRLTRRKSGQYPAGLRKPKRTDRDSLQLTAQGGQRAARVHVAISHGLAEPIPLRRPNAWFIPRSNRDTCIEKRIDEGIVTLLRRAILGAISVNQNDCRCRCVVRKPERAGQAQSICVECKRFAGPAIQTISVKPRENHQSDSHDETDDKNQPCAVTLHPDYFVHRHYFFPFKRFG